jgi:thymidine phosphorylase
MTSPPPTARPSLRVVQINLDTGRENVVIMSRRSKALRPEIFRGFSRGERRHNSKILLATLLIVPLVLLPNPQDRAIAAAQANRDEARKQADHGHAGGLPESPDAVAARSRTDAERRGNRHDHRRPHALSFDMEIAASDQLGKLHDQRRTGRAG